MAFSSAVLLHLRSNAIDFHDACNILWVRRPGNELDSRLELCRDYLQGQSVRQSNLAVIVQKTQKINEGVEPFQNLKENFM